MRLTLRLTVVFGTIGLLTLVGGSTLAYVLAAGETRGSIDNELLQRLGPFQSIAETLEPPVGSVLPDDVPARFPLTDANRFNTEGDTTQFQIVLDDGSRLGLPDVPLTPSAESSVTNETPHLETVEVDGTDYRVLTIGGAATFIPARGAAATPVALQLYRDITNEERALSNLAVQLAVLAAGGVAVVVAACWLVGRWIAKPVIQLAETAEHLAELEDVPGRVAIRRNDEIGRLADSYNRLMSAIEVGREQQRRLVADASHELRTPLTSLRMRVEFLADRDPPAETRRPLLRAAVADAEHLSALVNDLVDLAADVHSEDEALQQGRLGDVVEHLAQRASDSTRRPIEVAVDETIVDFYPGMVRRAVQNLIDNAVKYSPNDTPITVRQSGARIEVHDAGPGIAPEDVDHVFDRFFRSPKARTRPGNGIGLAIVKQVADAHHGDVWVGQSTTGGAAVGFSIGAVGRGR